ncbi:methyltransferase domain protein [Asticcacaulis biprosthecium C19]|uniref:Methyltransferase domain protein n=1 Tax=Asticcacaulis biprosthecium C19 TaxID=715226 RepID=F4QH04_9CAUL|nr:class I SAM-dependent methyltransferase [Asticcacaulis biprosthecium]EGF93757.1 methyltransferase domain protein [Asticcacaulis biprosthecium C19]
MDNLTIQQQGNSHTFAGRNAAFFKALHRAFGEQADTPLKILSFGCSTGEECLDIQKEFPNAQVFGTDIKQSALKQAMDKCPASMTIFPSNEAAIAQHGPYDAITAMSVFCKWPTTSELANISELYPFSTFEAGLVNLVRNLKIGGILLLQNAQYMVEDTRLAGHLHPINETFRESSGWIFKCLPDGTRVTTTSIEYDGKVWEAKEFAAVYPIDANDPNNSLPFRMLHRWHSDTVLNGRQPDIALWRKMSD